LPCAKNVFFSSFLSILFFLILMAT
jgi:hypothetical protein